MSTGKRVAFVIGANGPASFEGLQKLRWAEADAQNFAGAISKPHLKFDVVLPTSDTSLSLLAEFESTTASLKGNDELIFYFAGHGKVSRSGLYLLVNSSKDSSLVTSSIPYDLIKRMVDRCSAGYILAILDCCHAGQEAKDGLGRSLRSSPEDLNEAVKGTAGKALLACGPDGKARESDQLNGGLLTSLILRGIAPGATHAMDEGTGRISDWSLYSKWILPLTEKLNNQLSLGLLQGDRPKLVGSGGPFYLTLPPLNLGLGGRRDIEATIQNHLDGLRKRNASSKGQ